jgi:alanine-glyoxylate transaminase/serine-glyoxylate transaminase/serine-pyruvate transaminase
MALVDDTMDRLRQVWRTTNPLTFPMSGTGSSAMEAAFANFVNPGDPVVIGSNGGFSLRMADMAQRYGADVILVEAPWGQPLDPEALLAAHPSPALLATVHAETSTGVRNDLDAFVERHERTLLVVDCVTSLGGSPIEIDALGVDIAFSGTQKCLGVPPGMGPITISPRAVERMVPKPTSWYLDLNPLRSYVEGTSGRAYQHTPPISMLYAIHAGLGVLLAEGIEPSWKRHEEVGRSLQEGLEAMGLELFAAEGHRLAQLTTVKVPDQLPAGLDELGVRRSLRERYGIEISAGVGELAGKIWRIGLMGHNARPRSVALLLGALSEILDRIP